MEKENPKKTIVWKAETTHPLLIEPLRLALRQVADPEIGLDILQLGLVRDVTIEDNKATISMILTTPFCPYGSTLLESARLQAESALNMPTNIELGMEPWDFSMLEDGVDSDWGLF